MTVSSRMQVPEKVGKDPILTPNSGANRAALWREEGGAARLSLRIRGFPRLPAVSPPPVPRTAAAVGRLAWPILVAQLAIMATGVVDTVMSGHYSALDLAAVGIGASIYYSVFIGLLGVVQSLSPIAAQLYGAGRRAHIGEETRQTIWLAAGLALLGVMLLGFPEPFLRLAGAPAEVEVRVRAYLLGIAWALPGMLAFRVFFALTTAVSRPRAAMAINLLYFCAKVPLNYVFMYGKLGAPELGGPGCAVATAVVSWLAAAVGWSYCARHPYYRPFQVFARWSWPDPRILWSHLKLGVPMGLSFFVEVTSFTFIAIFVARLGAATSAAHQIAANVSAVVYMFGLAIGNATGVLVAQAVGGGRRHDARRTGLTGMGMMLAVSVCAAGVLLPGGGWIAALYTRDAEVRAIATHLLAFVAFYLLLDGVQVVIVNALRGYKIAFMPTVVYTVALWGVGLGGGYLLGLTRFEPARALGLAVPMGAGGFWLAAVISLVVAAAILFAYFLRASAVRPDGRTAEPSAGTA
jgi:MATE family, multidrug efflux pump